MEYLEGRTLDKIIKDQTLGYEECLRVALQLCSALEVVHQGEMIHRDLKPANILLEDDGNLKLLDFGIARAADESSITQHGMLVGTVLYMSPEQVRGDELDARSDIFSLGAVLYHVMTGQLPFPGESFPEVCMAILDGPPRRRPPRCARASRRRSRTSSWRACAASPPSASATPPRPSQSSAASRSRSPGPARAAPSPSRAACSCGRSPAAAPTRSPAASWPAACARTSPPPSRATRACA